MRTGSILGVAIFFAGSCCAFAQETYILHSFTGGADGYSPAASLTEISPSIFLGSSEANIPSGGVIFWHWVKRRV